MGFDLLIQFFFLLWTGDQAQLQQWVTQMSFQKVTLLRFETLLEPMAVIRTQGLVGPP